MRVDIPDGPAARATLVVYALRGHRVRLLADRPLEPGVHVFTWDGRDDAGRPVGSGAYLYSLRRDGEAAVRKMVLVK